MENFRVFRALGLSARVWFTNFLPITLLTALIYAPILVWAALLPSDAELLAGNAAEAERAYELFVTRGAYVLLGLSALVAPLVTFRVIKYMNGTRVSILTSVRFGLRGVLPAIIIGIVNVILAYVPMGFIPTVVLFCYWFVATPAAVAEKLGPGEALTRSVYLTAGRRWGILAFYLLGVVAIVALWLGVVMPAFESNSVGSVKSMVILVLVLYCAFQLFAGILQAVSYSLLRTDKEGVSNEELAAVFD